MGDFNNILLSIVMPFRQKWKEEIQEKINNINEMDLTDIYITVQPNTKEYAFFLVDHGNFSKICYIFGHKARLSINKKI